MTDIHPYKSRRSALWHPFWLIAALLTVCLVAGCESSHSTRTTSTTLLLEGGGSLDSIDGIRIEVGENIEFERQTHSETGYPTKTAQFINGWPLVIGEDHFTLGEHRFDGIERGDTLLFTSDGIAHNGTRRWDWPKPVDAE